MKYYKADQLDNSNTRNILMKTLAYKLDLYFLFQSYLPKG